MNVSSLCKLIALFLFVAHSKVKAYEKNPVSLQTSVKSNLKPVGISAAIAGLFVGKKFINGPNFEENVSLQGKIAVITGGNTGLGKETAVKLASLGASTYILCKSPSRAEEAVKEIVARSGGNTNVHSLELDLADLKSVQRCAENLKSSLGKIDILVNNAGVMAIPERTVTKDGFETHLGINHLGHYALTGMLWDLLLKSDAPTTRIINVASAAHLLGNDQLLRDDLMLTKEGSYGPWPAYGNSKLANILFTRELDRRIREQAQSTGSTSSSVSKVVTMSCHPGGCRTELGRYIVDPKTIESLPPAVLPLIGVAASPLLYFTKSAEEGAQTQIYLSASSTIAAAPSIIGSTPSSGSGSGSGGLYFDNSAPVSPSPAAMDAQLGRWLWEESQRLTGVKYAV